MSVTRKVLVISGCTLLLVALGLADAYLTKDILWFPGNSGVEKQPGPNVLDVAGAQGFTATEANEKTLLETVLPQGTPLTTRVLLKPNDRAVALAWTESPDVKAYFTALRKRLQSSFSDRLTDLIDETQTQPGLPPRDVLSFSDPAIHTDRLLFVRVRDRLYEFHVSPGKEADADSLLNALTE